ncbi:4-alpha-glucanotransferase [Thermodesulforhabdus norvegica]|uniref:4-alpha-glucanotransferase n=1 Tax=Thermodesulforhabdus norvegica TaxID=39841 RepID=A0A1I4VXA1_9BACT|nr:4-alpha-glucanotransferase [Thermodesulforhabdus norvegica]SFN05636.1 4-alpha-glucanotransferase [Thermodesulforhabdus norvegica]
MEKLLDFLSKYYGIVPSYYDIWGNLRVASPEQKLAVLKYMGVEAEDKASAERAVHRVIEDHFRKPVPPIVTADEGDFVAVPCVLTPGWNRTGLRFEWSLRLEDGTLSEGRSELDLADGCVEPLFPEFREVALPSYRLPEKICLEIPVRPPSGYHTLEIYVPDLGLRSTLDVVVSPAEAYRAIKRCWGLAVQLYAARSRRGGGMGSFYELSALMDVASRMGAAFVGINPLHYGYPENPHHISPYCASSRRFLNPLYVIPDQKFPESAAIFGSNVEEGDKNPSLPGLINYETLVPRLWASLKEFYVKFKDHCTKPESPLSEGFRRFIEERTPVLKYFGIFEYLRWRFGTPWYEWPSEFSHPMKLEEPRLPEGWQEGVEFSAFLQYIAHLQLSRCRDRGLGLHPSVLLYADLAVGVDRGGFDAWYDQECYALEADVGAPPDDFNPMGQKWGVVPFIPHRLTACSYRPFIEVIRANMAYASIIRIDHVMGLFRLFWIPSGFSPAQGVYVRYPLDDLARIVTLESVRNGCVVIGEDLGTVPDEIRQEMSSRKWFSYRVLYFSKNQDGTFSAPEEYPEFSIASVSTHDLPTLVGYWKAKDLILRRNLGMFGDEKRAEFYLRQREADKKNLLRAVMPDLDKLPDEVPFPELTKAVLGYIARSRSRLMAVQVEDLLMEEFQPNLPGTTTEYPCWRIRWSKPLEEIAEDSFVRQVALIIASGRKKSGPDCIDEK